MIKPRESTQSEAKQKKKLRSDKSLFSNAFMEHNRKLHRAGWLVENKSECCMKVVEQFFFLFRDKSFRLRKLSVKDMAQLLRALLSPFSSGAIEFALRNQFVEL